MALPCMSSHITACVDGNRGFLPPPTYTRCATALYPRMAEKEEPACAEMYQRENVRIKQHLNVSDAALAKACAEKGKDTETVV